MLSSSMATTNPLKDAASRDALVFTADTHIHPFKLCSNNGGRDRLEDAIAVLEQTFELCREYNATWIFAGDMKQPRTTWHQEALNLSLDVFDKYADIPKLMIPGNHDGPQLPGGSGLLPFASKPNTFVFETPKIILGKHFNLAFWPCDYDESGLHPFLTAAGSSHPEKMILVSHGMLTGCRLSPDIPGEGIPLSKFRLDKKLFRLAVFGDIHRGQIYNGKKWTAWDELLKNPDRDPAIALGKLNHGDIIYPGSPNQQNWGERKEPKGGLVITFPGWVGRVHLFDSPRFILRDWTDSMQEEILGYISPSYDKLAMETLAGNFVRFILPAACAERSFQEALAAFVGRHKMHSFEAIIQRAEGSAARTEIHAAMTPEKLLEEYIKARPPAEGLDKKAVLQAGLKLYGDSE